MKTLVWLTGAWFLFSLPAQAANPFRPAEVSDAVPARPWVPA